MYESGFFNKETEPKEHVFVCLKELARGIIQVGKTKMIQSQYRDLEHDDFSSAIGQNAYENLEATVNAPKTSYVSRPGYS
ncbi:hypothetical protein EWB00_000467 [Schistosoma japonicum]|uniref:Uncharacterized protein n=1 Tax=Schistosoma japonicum TaxID=6182 RepID=A0A4Z2CKY5_SCHJA|nr:hypothetical protein EWB00_000467 [Schistosoma japonicum]